MAIARRHPAAGSPPALTVAVLAVALALLYCGLRLLAADMNSYQAASFVSDWQGRGHVPSEKAWQVARDAAQRAVAVSPVASGSHYHRLGAVYEWRHSASYLGDPAARESRLAALAAYRRAAALRPLWPYGWVRLANLKLQLLELDGEFDEALGKAAALGPWRPRINAEVARIGLLAWHELAAGQRTLVLEALRRVAVQQPAAARDLQALAARLQLLAAVCGDTADGGRCSFRP